MKDDLKKYGAELLGTFVLVLIGCGSAVIAGDKIGFAGISFAFGLTVLAMVYAIGNISGCHINPAISVAMLTAGKMRWKDTIFYIIAQCIGAIIAAAILWAIATGKSGYSLANGLGQNGYGAQSPGAYSLIACLIAEIVLTMVFLLVIFGSTSKKAPEGFAGLSMWVLGIREKGRRYYWKLLAWALARRPKSFPTAVRLAIYGYHFRKVAESYTESL